jgi:glycolate oxidase iron-sulfur subunit
MNDLTACIHCGLCLSACPTYRILGDEAESPRGRLRLMDELGQATALDYAPLDRCLACRACESVGPSGVPYGEFLERARARRRPRRRWRWLVDHALSDARRTHQLARAAALLRRLGIARALPARWRGALDMLPAQISRAKVALPRSGSVAILPGCAQSVLQPEVLGALAELLRAAGETPSVPDGAVCCGALSAHQGSARRAEQLARQLIAAWAEQPQIVVPSAGCSAHIQHYPKLFAQSDLAEAATQFAARAQDAILWLAERGDRLHFRADPRRVVYHPPCHHSHAQGIRGRAERLLAAVPDLELVQAADAERCCGSAGSYSLEQPQLARAIRDAKWNDLRACAADGVLSANPGCELFLAAGRREDDPPVESLYPYLAARLGRATGNR